MYGCVSAQSDLNHHKNNNIIRIVPYLFSQKSKYVSFPDCKFANERDKEATARLVMFKELNILNSYTLESTFYGVVPQKSNKKKIFIEDEAQIKAEELVSVGMEFCSTLVQIVNSKILKKKFIAD